jgi:hypothetical protein
MGYGRRFSEPAENGGVVKQVVKGEEYDATKHQSNIQFKRALTAIIVLIFGEEPASCTET